MRAIVFGVLIAIAGCAPAASETATVLKKDAVDYSCQTAADCSIKDVGNCCGAYPQCVNKDSPTFPEKVKAQCAQQGMSSICGYPSISGCECVEGRCTGVPGTGGDGDVRKD
jgi:hypothetical protein